MPKAKVTQMTTAGQRHARKRTTPQSKYAKEGGVIWAIQQNLERAREKGTMIGVEDILKDLVRRFPKNPPEGMAVTVRAQLSRLPREKHFEIVKEREGRNVYYSAA